MKKFDFKKSFVNFLALAAGLAIIAGLSIIFLFFYTINQGPFPFWEDKDTLGVMGEFFGGTVGSIWALAGVILFYLALVYQKRELELQRQELKETREIMQSQSVTIAIQQFENTFFQLLNFHIDAAGKIRKTKSSSGKIINGFEYLFNDFKKEVIDLKKRRKNDGGYDQLDNRSFENCFMTVYDGYKNTFQHYFENYRTLVLFIGEKSHDPEFYFNILKSHFTEQEVLAQFYFVMLFVKDDQMVQTIEKYNLFQKLNIRSVTDIDNFHLDRIKKEAYAKPELVI